jgi:hypothetical protein
MSIKQQDILVPNFGITSPFYMKGVLAAVHIMSTFFVLEAFLQASSSWSQQTSKNKGKYHEGQNDTGRASNERASYERASYERASNERASNERASNERASNENKDNAAGNTHKDDGIRHHSLLDDAFSMYNALGDLVLDSVTYFPSMILGTMDGARSTEGQGSGFRSKAHAKEHMYMGSEQTTADHWWIKAVHCTRIQCVMQYMTGQAGFIYIPEILCVFALLAACMPTMVAFPKYREDVIAIVLATVLYVCIAGHACALLMYHRILPFSGLFAASHAASYPSALVFGSIFMLHVCAHAMHQCIQTYTVMVSRVRQVTSGSILFIPLVYSALVVNYFLAMATPVILYSTPQFSMKDVIVMHAIASLWPECMGVIFRVVMYAMRKLMDTPSES